MSRLREVELRHLRYFVAVAKHGSFNRAAQSLHYTQPALSRQVKDLEEELAIPLFVRGKNTVALTAAGEMFYEEAREILARAELAIQRVRQELPTEVLRIGYAPSVTADVLPRALQRFRADHPRVRIELADLFPLEMANKARNGELDIVITLESAGARMPTFQWAELFRIPLVLVMPAHHPLAKLKRISPQHLRDVDLVGLGPETFPEYAPFLRKILKPFAVRPRFVALERDGVATMFTTIESFKAAAVVAKSAVSFMPRSLVSRPFSPALQPVVAKIGWSNRNPRPHAEAFVAHFRKAARG